MLTWFAALAVCAQIAPPQGPTGYAVTNVECVGSTVLATVGSRLLRSSEAGGELVGTRLRCVDPIEDVAVSPAGRIYAVAGGCVYVSADDGATFDTVTPDLGDGVALLTVEAHLSEPSEAWIGYDGGRESGGVLRTTDGGLHWEDVSPPLWAGPCVGIAFDPERPSRVALARRTDVTFHSTDGGERWVSRRFSLDDDEAFDIGFAESGLVLATSLRTLRSSDDGTTWCEVAAPEVAGFRVPVATPNAPAVATPFGLLRRSSGGEWAMAGLAPSVAQLAEPLVVIDHSVDPSDPSRVAAVVTATSSTLPRVDCSMLVRSEDVGESWTFQADFAPDVRAVQFAPNGAFHVGSYVVLDGENSEAVLVRESPSGWKSIGPRPLHGAFGECLAIAFDPENTAHVFAVVSMGPGLLTEREVRFCRSTDAGETWEQTDWFSSDGTRWDPRIAWEAGATPGGRRLTYVQREQKSWYGRVQTRVRVSDDGGQTFASLGE